MNFLWFALSIFGLSFAVSGFCDLATYFLDLHDNVSRAHRGAAALASGAVLAVLSALNIQ